MTSILQLPTPEKRALPYPSSPPSAKPCTWGGPIAWSGFSFRSNKLEGKKLVYCFFVFRPFLLDCFWEDVVPIIPGTPQFLKVNSVLNRHRGDESHRGPILGPVGQGTISLWNLLSFSQPSLSLGRMCRLACPTCDQANLYNAHRWFGRLPGWLNATPLSGTDNFQALC